MYRPFLHNKESDANYMEIIIGKQRHGPLGVIYAYNDLEKQRITEA